MQTVYITKYCLSSSILKIDAEIKESKGTKKEISAYGKIQGGYTTGFYNDDFHLTEEEAFKDAESRRIKKIESLKKQIAKLENKKFVIK
jgi:hypothetical protein